jgi:4-carboxymuconolactone decarboxylase
MPEPAQPSSVQTLIGDFSPKMVSLTEQVLFGDVWERPGLSKRDRSLATISVLIATRATDQLTAHLKIGVKNGLTQQEIVELITHMAFYAGWPAAMNAIAAAKTVFEANQ